MSGRAQHRSRIKSQISWLTCVCPVFFFFSSRRRHTRLQGDRSSDVCSSDLFRIDITRHEKSSMTGEGRVGGGSVKVARPLTYMNLSGDAVKLLVNAYLESTDDLMVV